jgi:ABC-type transporter Mla maintaining outer membrane lipid asymmetry ATPase subunit MlaF
MNKVADRVVFLHEGGAIYNGPVKGLYTFDHPHVQEFLHLDEVSMSLSRDLE